MIWILFFIKNLVCVLCVYKFVCEFMHVCRGQRTTSGLNFHLPYLKQCLFIVCSYIYQVSWIKSFQTFSYLCLLCLCRSTTDSVTAIRFYIGSQVLNLVSHTGPASNVSSELSPHITIWILTIFQVLMYV